MTMLRPFSRCLAEQRGFTLTEIAIVLGVIGILTGAVWTAGTSVTRINRANQAVQDIQQIVDNVRSMYMGAGSFGVTGITNVSATLITAGAIPSSLVTGPTSAINAWNAPVWVWFMSSRIFRVSYYSTPRDACVRILSQLANLGTADGPVNVVTGCGAGVSAVTSAGLTLPVIDGLCTTTNPVTGCMSTELDYAIH